MVIKCAKNSSLRMYFKGHVGYDGFNDKLKFFLPIVAYRETAIWKKYGPNQPLSVTRFAISFLGQQSLSGPFTEQATMVSRIIFYLWQTCVRVGEIP